MRYNGIKIVLRPSSNVVDAGFDASAKTMLVEFKNGSKYIYYDVPGEFAIAGTRAESAGSFFNENIKGFKYAKYSD